ncbi:high-affinity glucose transporter Hxt2p [[Candida] railenensis]|uniref:High-affinity glucose transporter Hxt2p n=1 Tax=[Candida] railenensis TaxID=45579 RepID=A0A9P0QWI8_9ASCO|nr:high-affinity glucose transporter Hxt2p [[Candida] railenensis]
MKLELDNQKESTDYEEGRELEHSSSNTPVLEFREPEPIELENAILPLTRKERRINLLHCCIISLTGLPLGWDVGTTGHIVSSKVFSDIFLNSATSVIVVGTIVSILNLGCIVGAMTIGRRANSIGMKLSIWISSLVYMLGTGIEFLSFNLKTSWWIYALGRLLCGVFIGVLGVVGPTYIGNIVKVPNAKRKCISWHQISCCFGIVLGNVMILAFREKSQLLNIIGSTKSLICLLVSAIVIVVPESKSKRRTIRDGEVSEHKNVEIFQAKFMISTVWKTFPSKHLVDNLKCCSIMVLQQLSGINFFFYYVGIIFTGISPMIPTILLGVINFATSFVSGSIFEKIGTRRSLFIGSIGMSICMILFATVGLFGVKHKLDFEGFLVVVVGTYVILFATSWGPGSSVMVNEISVTSESMAIAICSNWSANFVVAISTPVLSSKITFGLGYIFAFFLLVSAALVDFWY